MTHKLDLTKTLTALDVRKKNYYYSLTEEEQKAFQAFVLLRYMSSSPNGIKAELSLISVNEIVNVYFWDLAKEVELQAKLLAVSGLGEKTYHKWIPLRNKKTNKLNSFVSELFENNNWFCNDFEIKLYLNKMTVDDFRYIIEEMGKTKEEEKKLIEEFKKMKG